MVWFRGVFRESEADKGRLGGGAEDGLGVGPFRGVFVVCPAAGFFSAPATFFGLLGDLGVLLVFSLFSLFSLLVTFSFLGVLGVALSVVLSLSFSFVLDFDLVRVSLSLVLDLVVLSFDLGDFGE